MKFVTGRYQTVNSQNTSSRIQHIYCLTSTIPLYQHILTYLLNTCPGAFISWENLSAQLFFSFSPSLKRKLDSQMMRADNKGRSASPHRITYKSDFHAIKCSFDTGASLKPGSKLAAITPSSAVHLSSLSDPIMSHTSKNPSTGSRGRVHSTRGTKIRENIFLQMDSQQLKQDVCPGLSSSSTPLLSPQNPSHQPQTSPFSGARRSFASSSSVLDTVANMSTPESFLQDRLSRSEEIVDIDRAALAQKFSVTRRLFETKVMERESSGGQLSKGSISRGSRGMVDGNAEEKLGRGDVIQLEKGEVSGKRRHTEGESFDLHNSMNLPIINVSLPNPHIQASLTGNPTLPILDGPEASDTSSSCLIKYNQNLEVKNDKEASESAALDLCLTPEESVRAERVDVKNESSESDENEEEKVRKAAKNWLIDEGKAHMGKTAAESKQDLEDDVFEEPSLETYMLENGVGPRDRSKYQEESSVRKSCEGEAKNDGEHGGDKYRQVNEQREGQSCWVISEEEKSTEKRACREKKTAAGVEERAGRQDRGMMQEEGFDKQAESHRVEKGNGAAEACGPNYDTEKGEKEGECEKNLPEEQATQAVEREECRDGNDDGSAGQEDQIGSELICGIENEAFVYEQESQARPGRSTSPRRERDNKAHSENSPEYEEIPGVPEVANREDEDTAEAAERKVRFSSAPIKVRLIF